MRAGFAQLAQAEQPRQGPEIRAGKAGALSKPPRFIAGFLLIGTRETA